MDFELVGDLADIETIAAGRSIRDLHGLRSARFVKAFNAVPSAPRGDGQASDVRSRLGLGDDSVALVIASRAIHEKGWDVAIDATRRLRADTGRDVQLVLVGDGEHLSVIQDRAKDAPYVHFWGRAENAAAIIRACDIAVFPTTYPGESFPLFVLECFAAGLPVVATDVGSIREMLTTEDGGIAGALISANGDRGRMAGDMAAAVKALLPAASRQGAARHAQRRAAHYDINKMADLYLDVFASVSTTIR